MRSPQKATDILSKGNTFFFRSKASSYGLFFFFFKSYYNINLILPLPLIMPEFFLTKTNEVLIYVVDFLLRPRLPQWKLRH